MFIRTELIKKFKEEVFKEKLQNILNPFLNFAPNDDIRDILNHNVKVFNDKSTPFSSNSKRHEMYNLLMDIRFSNIDDYEFVSELGQELETKYLLAIARVDRRLECVTDDYGDLFEVLKTFDKDSYIVGGYIRDAIAGRKSNDLDICTSTPYNELKEVFKEKGWETKDTGKQFLVLNVIHPETKENFEIANLRKDKNNEGAQIGTIFEDAERRDFANSAVYYSIKTGKLLDPSGKAINDCLNNVIQFMGNAQDRIDEDPLRAIRAYRFICRGWEPTHSTLKACRRNIELVMKTVAPTRVMLEIEKMANL